MQFRREEEERRIYQNISPRGNRKEYVKRDQLELEGTNENEFKEINPVYGCLVPCLKCCIYPCRAFFLTGRCISQRRRMKKVKYNKRSNNNNACSYGSNGQKPQYNQFYSASSNIGANQNFQGSINTDGSVKGNLRHPTLTGNCITPICSGSSASFCTIQAEYPSNRRSVLPSSSSYGPRRYVEKTDELPIYNESNKLTCYCLGNSNQAKEFEEKCVGVESNSFLETLNDRQSREIDQYDESHFNEQNHNKKNELDDCFTEGYDRERFYTGKLSEYNPKYDQTRFSSGSLLTKSIFSSCAPCEYSDHVSQKYSQGNCFVDN